MEVCAKVPHNCNFNYKNLTLQTCSNCAPWSPTQRKPPGLSPFNQCPDNSVGACKEGCNYHYGATVAPLFPSANATTCACRGWSSVPCDGGTKGEQNKWPCDAENRTGSEFWYCEDGPGWKPPLALRARGRALRAAAKKTRAARAVRSMGEAVVSDVGRVWKRGERGGRGGRGERGERDEGPRSPNNPFETLWRIVPVRVRAAAVTGGDRTQQRSSSLSSSSSAPASASAAASYTVTMDLSAALVSSAGEGTVHAVRYAWPLGDDGDTCCPSHAVTGQAPTAACAPGSCSIYSSKTELPANPFFARVTSGGKCECPSPQKCDA